jgi:predicted MFS family arabinose efflux permease
MRTINTKRNSGIAAGIAALMTVATMIGSAAPASASELTKLLGQDNKSRQGDKNNMRNLGIGLGAAAAYSVLKGKGTQALVLGAGAAYSAKKYEDARKAQAKENDRENRRYRYNNRYSRR